VRTEGSRELNRPRSRLLSPIVLDSRIKRFIPMR
jgi:hypothetical protein